MRSDRDKRTETEREIDEFLSKFESPADELSADINSYLDENDPAETDIQKTVKVAAAQTFTWKNIEPSEMAEVQDGNKTDTSVPSGKENDIDAKEEIPSEIISSASSEKTEKAEINMKDDVIENPVITEEKTQEVKKDAEIQNDKVDTEIKENTDTAESKENKVVSAKQKKSKKKSKNKRPLKKGDIVRILFLKKKHFRLRCIVLFLHKLLLSDFNELPGMPELPDNSNRLLPLRFGCCCHTRLRPQHVHNPAGKPIRTPFLNRSGR